MCPKLSEPGNIKDFGMKGVCMRGEWCCFSVCNELHTYNAQSNITTTRNVFCQVHDVETRLAGAVHDHTPGFCFFLLLLFHSPRRAMRALSFSSGNSPVKPPDLFVRYVIIQVSRRIHTRYVSLCTYTETV